MPGEGTTATYTLDGRRITSRATFYAELGRAVNGEGGYFGSNLDALFDCLRGGFGTPEEGRLQFHMTHAKAIRAALGDKYFCTVLGVFEEAGVGVTLDEETGHRF